MALGNFAALKSAPQAHWLSDEAQHATPLNSSPTFQSELLYEYLYSIVWYEIEQHHDNRVALIFLARVPGSRLYACTEYKVRVRQAKVHMHRLDGHAVLVVPS